MAKKMSEERLRERLDSLEMTLRLLTEHTHDSQGNTVIPIIEAIETTESAVWNLRREHRKENEDAESD